MCEAMVRKLKYHEKKLLKKTDFINWKYDKSAKESEVIGRFYIQKREEYVKYVHLCGEVTSLVSKLKAMQPNDPVRQKVTEDLLEKLYSIGLISSKKSLALCDHLGVSSFCRRRLPVIMVRNKMAPNLKAAVTFVEQGHVRVGPQVVNDPATLITRNMEDYVTWVDSSKIKRKILKYRDQVDDYDLM